MNEGEKKIGLSLRAVAEDEERTRLEDYQRQAAAATMTIEEAMNLEEKGKAGKHDQGGIDRGSLARCGNDAQGFGGYRRGDFRQRGAALRAGDKIEIRGFGSFRTRQRQPRVGRNPKTGARVEVPAKRIPYFKPSKELKDLVNHDRMGRLRRRSRRHELSTEVARHARVRAPHHNGSFVESVAVSLRLPIDSR